MHILELSYNKREVVLSLSADELIKICNAMFSVEEKNRGENFYKLNSDLVLARDLCQYGHIDNFTLSSIVDSRAQYSNIKDEIKRREERRENKLNNSKE